MAKLSLQHRITGTACALTAIILLGGCGARYADPIEGGGGANVSARGGAPTQAIGGQGGFGGQLGDTGGTRGGAAGAAGDPCGNVCLAGQTCTPSLFMTAEVFGSSLVYADVVADDFNGDGWPDIAFIDALGNAHVRLGSGLGVLGATQTIATDASVLQLMNGDVNGDGKPDLMLTIPSTNTVRVMLGLGDGTFAAPVETTVGIGPGFAAAGDVDGDGKLDIVLTSNQGPAVMVWLRGHNDGTFDVVTPPLSISPTKSSISMVLGDVDGNGVLDVVLTHDLGIAVLLGTKTGTFTLASDVPVATDTFVDALADVNEDGHLDLLVTNTDTQSFGVLFGQGESTFSEGPSTDLDIGKYNGIVAVADLDADGHVDVLTGGGADDDLNVFLGRGDGTFALTLSYPEGAGYFTLADFDRDGRRDLVSGDGELLFGNGDGSFQAARSFTANSQSEYLALADVNGDGNLDALSVASDSNSNYTLVVQPGNGHGAFGVGPWISDLGMNITSMAVGDIDGDGVPDLATVSSSVAGVTVTLGIRDGFWTTGPTIMLPYPCLDVAVADFNNDGRLDLLASSQFGGELAILLNVDKWTFEPSRPLVVAPGSHITAVGDLNQDGRVDLAVLNQNTNDVSIFLGLGDGTFGPSHAFATPPSPAFIAIANNRNGRADLVVGTGVRRGGLGYLLGDGAGAFAAPRTVPFGSPQDDGYLGALIATDFNGDGVSDILTRRYGAVTSVLLGLGDGTFQEGRPLASLGLAPTIGDLDHDGRPDLVFGYGDRIGVALSTSQYRCR